MSNPSTKLKILLFSLTGHIKNEKNDIFCLIYKIELYLKISKCKRYDKNKKKNKKIL
jgi:hypothetical protein